MTAFLARRRVAHLATADERGRPHVVPVCYAVVGGTIYVPIDEKPKRLAEPRALRRVRNLLANPRAALSVDLYDDGDWSRLGWVLLEGPVRLLESSDSSEHATAIAALRERYLQYQSMALERSLLISLEVQRVATWGRLDS
ncbi:MAG TPA: TIGR03668 family PPOX class F420-dependent oxidoreductase [Nonomuraea sp.]|nr:TIGR03668 family PPOX class F420-dependent oxidoreductase [Nonomuraea sp.]